MGLSELKTEICNQALALLGGGVDEPFLTDYDTDATTNGDLCRRFYDPARRNALKKWDWTEALDLVAGTDAGADVANVEHQGYDYAYLLPQGGQRAAGGTFLKCLAFRGLRDEVGGELPCGTNMPRAPWLQVGSYVHTDYATSDFWWHYIADLEDASQFSDGLKRCIAYELAILLAGPVLRGEAGAKMRISLTEEYRIILNQARAENQATPYDVHNNSGDGWWDEIKL